MNILEKIKDHDIMLGDNLIMLTGRGFILQAQHGVCLETEEEYGEVKLNDNKPLKLYNNSQDDLIYENYIVIAIGALHREGEKLFVERKRPKNFVSKTTAGLDIGIDVLMEQFQDKYSNYLKKNDIRFYDTDGGLTVDTHSCSLFDLQSAKVVEELEVEVVKRLAVPYNIIKQMLESESRAKSFFEGIDQDMRDVDCKYYTFKYPDGDYYLRRSSEASRNIEIRACGKAKEKI